MTETKMLQIQSKNMVIVAIHFSTTSEIWNAFLISKVETNNQRLNKVKISNLKIV
jgi:autotransporter adhesin